MKSPKKTYFNEIPARESRHLLLKGLKAFNLITVLSVALGLLALTGRQGYQWALQSPLFQMKDIAVEGNRIISEERILSLAGIDPQCNIFLFDVNAAEKRIAEDHFVREVKVKRRLPSKVVISIEERVPLVFLENFGGMIDGESVLLPPLPVEHWPDLPILTGVDMNVEGYGEPLQSDRLKWVISFLKDMSALKSRIPLEISEIDVSDVHHPLLYTGDGAVPIRIGGTGSLSQLISLPLVLTDLDRKGIEAEYIDVRFSDQIVVRPKRNTNMGSESKVVKG